MQIATKTERNEVLNWISLGSFVSLWLRSNIHSFTEQYRTLSGRIRMYLFIIPNLNIFHKKNTYAIHE